MAQKALQTTSNPHHFQHAITSSLHHITTPTILISPSYTAPFRSEPCELPRPYNMAASQDKRTDDWASPQHFHKYAQRYAYKQAARFGAEMQREEAREWSVLPKEEPRGGNSMPAKHAKEEEARSVLPTGSAIPQNITKLASIATHSTATQTVDPVSGGSSLLHWLTSTTTNSTATQT